MVEDQVVSLVTNLTAAGVTTAGGLSYNRARGILQRRKYSEEIESVATEFLKSLEKAVEHENNRRDSKELTGVTEDWDEITMRLANKYDEETRDDSVRESDQLEFLFKNEEEAVDQIAEAIAETKGFDVNQTPDLKQSLKAALTRAYREAIAEFERQLAGTDLTDIFQMEMDIEISTQVEQLQLRLAEIGADIESLFTRPAKDEGFRQLTPSEFALGPDPRPERSWRIGFTLSDVRAGIPAQRLGRGGEQLATEKLFESLQEGEDCIVLGGTGSGKSTLCKQVAVRWYENQGTGPVLYRESGAGGRRFQSVEALKQAITSTEGHTLIVVEDAVQPEANAIFEVYEKLAGYDQVTFLFDALRTEVDAFSASAPVESKLGARQADILKSLSRYHIPRLSRDDIHRVICVFEEATGRTVDRSPDALHGELQTRSDIGIGKMMLLSFLLPVERDEDDTTGLERNVRKRFETVEPEYETALRDLSRFNPELVADIGAMVTLLNAGGIGIRPELVHSLAVEYGHDWETHDEIADIRAALEGWFLYSAEGVSGNAVVRTTHQLWSKLYLRELALTHEQQQRNSRRRQRSNRRLGRCVKCLCALFENEDHLEELHREFPDSPLLTRIEQEPEQMAEEYLLEIFGLGEEWPALASLFGTTSTASYNLPKVCTDNVEYRIKELRGHTQRLRGNHESAETEYKHAREFAEELGNVLFQARCYNHLGLLAEMSGDIDVARDRLQEGLEMFRQHGSIEGEAVCLTNLGIVELKEGNLQASKEYHEKSRELFHDNDRRHIEAAHLGNLANIENNKGNYERAHDYLRQSLDIARSSGNRLRKAEALMSLALVERNKGNLETAKEYVERSVRTNTELGNRHGEAKSLTISGLLARDDSNWDLARKHYERALSLYRAIEDKYGEASVLGGLGMLELAEDNHETATERLERSRNLFETLGDKRATAESVGLLGAVELSRGNVETGRELLNNSRSRFSDIDAPLTEVQVLRYHIEIEFEHQNHDRVHELHQAAMSCFDSENEDLGYEQNCIESIYQAVT